MVGLGYAGLPLAVEMARAGFRTKGVDVQPGKVQLINAGTSYVDDIADDDLRTLVATGTLQATTDFCQLVDCDFIAICVPTPLDERRQPNTSFMEAAARSVAPFLKSGAMVVLESTTYPGTTEELIAPLLEEGSGLRCETDFFLGFSPERVDPGNLHFSTANTPKVVGAMGDEALAAITAVYEAVLDGGVVKVSSPAVAEMEKLLENTYRNINIAFVNEMAMLCDRLGIDVWEVIEAAKTKPYGFSAFYPGPGLGGHCIPLDPTYLAWRARQCDFCPSMIEAAGRVNAQMPTYCVERIARMLEKRERSVNGSSILVLGVAYKPDVSDYRESPALEIIDLLETRGAHVAYYDPLVSKCVHRGEIRQSLPALTLQALGTADVVVIACDHQAVDYQFVQSNAKAIFDTRNALKDIESRDNIETL